jgi:hypothetical protein
MREKVGFGSQFWSLQTFVDWSVVFGPGARQDITLGREW